MGTEASLTMLCSVAVEAIRLIDVFVTVYSLVIFVYILSSWIPLPYTRNINRVRRFLYDACEPYLRLFRRFVPPFGAFDLSPILAILVLVLVGQAVNAIIARYG